VVDSLGSTIDLLETFASLSGTSAPTDRKMDGHDLSPALLGQGKSSRDEFFYWTKGELHAVRSGPWKLHVVQREPINYGKEAPMDHPELYHLGKDISEAYDVSATHPAIVAELARRLEAHRTDTADSLPEQLSARTPNFEYRR
jgi:arylsulfatase